MYRLLLLLLILSFAYVNKSLSQVSIVADLYPGKKGSDPFSVTKYNGKLVFYGTSSPTDGRQIWILDNQYVPKQIYKFKPLYSLLSAGEQSMLEHDGKLYFSGSDSIYGSELWEYDGSVARMLVDINTNNSPADFGLGGSGIRYMVAARKWLYFSAWKGAETHELWRYDINKGTAEMVFYLPGTNCRDPRYMTTFRDDLYFMAFPDNNTNIRQDLFRHQPGTLNFENVDVPGVGGSNSWYLYNGYDKLYYYGTDGQTTQNHLYLFDSVTYKSTLITSLKSSSQYSDKPIVSFDGAIYYAADDANIPGSCELYKIDTGTNKVTLLFGIDPRLNITSYIQQLTVFNDKLFFTAEDGVNGRELWSYDGQNAPVMIADINVGPGGSNPEYLTVIGDTLYFTATDTNFGREVYRYVVPTTNSIESAAASSKFNIYPNPTTGHITIDLGKVYDNASVEIVSMLGQNMFAKTYQAVAGMKINIEAPAGTYLVHIKAGGEEYTSMKILKTD